MAVFGTTFWIGCKKEDAIFSSIEMATPFKGKVMTIEAAKTHYRKTQQDLGLNLRTTNDGDVDWANAVIDTAANGQVEVVAPVKDWAYTGTDGRKWAINTKFEYDENGNPQGNYVIVTHEVGNTANDFSAFSGHIWYFGMNKKFQEGYKYDNGVGTPEVVINDTVTPPANGYIIWHQDANGCDVACDYEVDRTAPTKYGGQNTINSSSCMTFCESNSGSGGGGSGGGGSGGGSSGGGFSGGTGGTGGGGSGGGGSGAPPTYTGAPATIYDYNMLACLSYIQKFPCMMNEYQMYSFINNAANVPGVPNKFSELGISSILLRDILTSTLSLTTAQVNFFKTQSIYSYMEDDRKHLISQLFGLNLGLGYTTQMFNTLKIAHLNRCIADATYNYWNAKGSTPYPAIGTRNFWNVGRNIIFPLYLEQPDVNQASLSATQMAFLKANKQVAWQISNYLLDPQVITPGNNIDPFTLTQAEKVAEMNALMELFMDNPDLAQAYANAGFPALGTDPWWMMLLRWAGYNTQPYEKKYNDLSQKEKAILNTMPGPCYKIMISN